ncbi:MAG: 23S rRNA (adenine(2503)-C(2))-methyltransferase RlmN [Phycisphaerae bacterium]|nr:23S rRNA (adenine(2503)-C(2))-methyltransferase RlmN [Phycisphaerae bacterium]
MDAPCDRQHLLGTSLDEFAASCEDCGMPPYRAQQVFEWVYAKGAHDFAAMTNLSKPLREQWARQWIVRTATVDRRQISTDGTVKLLLRWPDGAASECVLIPDGRRRTACISSQVGCPVGCAFCASGLNGLQRQLSAGEIVEQVMHVRDLCEPRTPEASAPPGTPPLPEPARLSNIVVMGLGEPLANYAALLRALRIINAPWGPDIGARSITVSTVGLPTQIRRLAKEGLQINLAVSLHAPEDKLRGRLIPWAKRVPIEELVAAGREYYETTHRELTIEYILLDGVNDQPEHATQLVKICRQMRCNVNLIKYNPVPGLPFDRPKTFAVQKFVERLRERGVNVHIRKSRGLDIDAACGQLRRSTLAR